MAVGPQSIDGLLELAQTDPNEALRRVRQEIDSGIEPDSGRHVQLLNARARALHALGLLEQANDAANATLLAARETGLHQGEAAQTLGFVAMHHGRSEQAISTIEPLISVLAGPERADVHVVLATLHGSIDDADAAYRHYEHASQGLDRRSDMRRLFFLLNNRSVLHLDTGRFNEAILDLREAAGLAAEDDNRLLRAIAIHNQGVAEARLGHLGTATELFDTAVQTFEALAAGFALANAYLDRADLLLDAGLVDEARQKAVAGAEIFERAGAHSDVARARQLLVRVELVAGSWERASELLAEFGTEHDSHVAPISDADGLSAVVQELVGAPTTDSLLAPGQLGVAASIEYGLHMLQSGRKDMARGHLQAAVSAHQRDLSALASLNLSVAHAYLASIEADTAAVGRHVDEGLSTAGDNLAALGATALRSAAQRRVDQLVSLGLTEAFQNDDLERCVRTIETARSVSLHPEPPASEEDRSLLATLRHTTASLRAIDESSPQYFPLLRRRVDVEADLRARRRRSASNEVIVDNGPSPLRTPPATSGDTALYLLDISGKCVAITKRDNSVAAHEVGHSATMAKAIDALSLALELEAERLALISVRKASPVSTSPSRDAPSTGVGLDDLLKPLRSALDPVLQTITGDHLVVITDALFHALPWALITRHVTAIAASHTLFEVARHPTQAHSDNSTTLVVTGPGMATSDGDVVIQAAPNAATLQGAEATSSAVIAAFQDFDTVHIAAHGHFRADSPLFSHIELHDGPLTFFEMSAGTKAPRRVIFASCDVGKGVLSSPLSVASILHHRGCSGVVASAGRVGDTTTNKLFRFLHQHLSQGDALPDALRESQQALLAEDPSVALFRCYGPG